MPAIDEMLAIGLTLRDIAELEDLSSPAVLSRAAAGRRLERHRREDAVYYMELWADLLDEELASDELPSASMTRERTAAGV